MPSAKQRARAKMHSRPRNAALEESKGDFFEGQMVTFEGQEYVVVSAIWKGNGWRQVLATADGGAFYVGDTCACTAPQPLKAVELVSEMDFVACAGCRKKIARS